MRKGIIISFEGIDGCGKTTQAKMFCDYLKKKGMDVLLLNEPGGTPAGEKIREILLDKKIKICPLSELFLYLASRAQLAHEAIRPGLAEGKTVVLDRYIDSTAAYQGCGRNLDMTFITDIQKNLVSGLLPDITFFIDAPAENLSDILKNKDRDRIERESLGFQKKVRTGYMQIAKAQPARIKVIKRKSPGETQKAVIKEWEKFVNEQKIRRKFPCEGAREK